jgi:hypothetical protein
MGREHSAPGWRSFIQRLVSYPPGKKGNIAPDRRQAMSVIFTGRWQSERMWDTHGTRNGRATGKYQFWYSRHKMIGTKIQPKEMIHEGKYI